MTRSANFQRFRVELIWQVDWMETELEVQGLEAGSTGEMEDIEIFYANGRRVNPEKKKGLLADPLFLAHIGEKLRGLSER